MTDPFAGAKKVDPGKFTWGKIGDYLIGYFNSSSERDTDNGRKKLYEIKAITGQYHISTSDTDENGNKVIKVADEATVVDAGEFFEIWGRDDIDKFFRKVKLGQKVGLRFTKITPSKKKGYSPFKTIETVMWDEQDPDFMGASVEDMVEEVGV